MANNKVVRGIRDGLVIVAAILMISVVIFQWMEVREFQLQDIIKTRLSALFASEEEEVEQSEAPAVAAPNPSGAPLPGVRSAVDAKNNAQAEAGL